MKNEAKGYDPNKENSRLPKLNNDRSYLQNRGAAILGAGGARSPAY
jgi:hypothetical protein